MAERDTPWPVGTPCWVDLMTSDAAAARTFYEGLFGWELMVGPPEVGGYTMAEIGGRPVAGLGEMPADNPYPPAWSTYLATEDARATGEAITTAGGTLLIEPMDVIDVGVMAMASDPTGAVFGIWQARAHTGFRLANVANTLTWNELMTRDNAAAKAFYAAVFGYTYTEIGNEEFQYSTIEVGGNTVGGLGTLPAEVPAEVPAHWRAYFAVDDVDEAVTKLTGLGGSVHRAAQDTPYGRMADVADPQGAMFSLIKPAPPA